MGYIIKLKEFLGLFNAKHTIVCYREKIDSAPHKIHPEAVMNADDIYVEPEPDKYFTDEKITIKLNMFGRPHRPIPEDWLDSNVLNIYPTPDGNQAVIVEASRY